MHELIFYTAWILNGVLQIAMMTLVQRTIQS